MAFPTRIDTETSQLLQLLEELPMEKFECFAFISAIDFLDSWVMGPFRYVFNLKDDRTVYALAQTDLYAEFNIVDFVKWFLAEEQYACTTFVKVHWHDLTSALMQARNDQCSYYSVPGNVQTEFWEAVRVFTEIFYPFCLPFRPAWQ